MKIKFFYFYPDNFYSNNLIYYGSVAQSAEQQPLKLLVEGSSPSRPISEDRGDKEDKKKQRLREIITDNLKLYHRQCRKEFTGNEEKITEDIGKITEDRSRLYKI